MNPLIVYINDYVNEVIKDVKAEKSEQKRVEIALYHARCLERDVKGGIILLPKKPREEALKVLPDYKRKLIDSAFEKSAPKGEA